MSSLSPLAKLCLEIRRQHYADFINFYEEPSFYKDYKGFIEEIIDCRDVEQNKYQMRNLRKKKSGIFQIKECIIPRSQGWFVLFLIAVPRTKEDDWMIVFYRDQTLQTNVLWRFRQGQIAIMCDIEKMFHQFKVMRLIKTTCCSCGLIRMETLPTSIWRCISFGLHHHQAVPTMVFDRQQKTMGKTPQSPGSS